MSTTSEINETNLEHVKHTIQHILKKMGLYDWFHQDPSIYIGGSQISYILSHPTYVDSIENDTSHEMPHDIDVYTTNHVNMIRNFDIYKANFNQISYSGCIITFNILNNPLSVQLITAEIDNFYDDVLGNYDCDLVCIGYHPASDQVIIHERFKDAISSRIFYGYKHLSSIQRSSKLEHRVKSWYHSDLRFIGEDFGRMDEYYSSKCQSIESFMIRVPPKYTQLFYNLYNCIRCHKKTPLLLCEDCRMTIYKIRQHQSDTDISVIGGCNGLGKIIGDTYEPVCRSVTRTSREVTSNPNLFQFSLGHEISVELMTRLMSSDVIVMNATKTLDNDERVWNTTLPTFNKDLLYDRIETNVCGYVKLITTICQYRITKLDDGHPLKKLVIVYTDANESKFDGKMVDCRHLEINVAKAGVKQIFYTNSYLFAKLNMLVVCYDPGWLSFHGISIEQKKAKSPKLIPPVISSKGIIYIANKMLRKFDRYMKKKKFIREYSVYDYINKTLRET